jgi:hypothetical protein
MRFLQRRKPVVKISINSEGVLKRYTTFFISAGVCQSLKETFHPVSNKVDVQIMFALLDVLFDVLLDSPASRRCVTTGPFFGATFFPLTILQNHLHALFKPPLSPGKRQRHGRRQMGRAF